MKSVGIYDNTSNTLLILNTSTETNSLIHRNSQRPVLISSPFNQALEPWRNAAILVVKDSISASMSSKYFLVRLSVSLLRSSNAFCFFSLRAERRNSEAFKWILRGEDGCELCIHCNRTVISNYSLTEIWFGDFHFGQVKAACLSLHWKSILASHCGSEHPADDRLHKDSRPNTTHQEC